jgi:hypothetical protein
METFYRDVLDKGPELNAARDRGGGYAGDVAFLSDDNIQFHLARRDLGICVRTGRAVNPLDRGRIAARTDDAATVKQRRVEKDIAYSDYGTWAMRGWRRLLFYGPDGNVIGVRQVDA